MFYHFLAPEDGHPTWEEHFIEKYQNGKIFFSKPHQQTKSTKARDSVSKSAANIFLSNKYDFFPIYHRDKRPEFKMWGGASKISVCFSGS